MSSTSLEEQLKIVKGSGLDEKAIDGVSRAAMFHGHICPGLAIGISASISYMHQRSRSEDEELVAVVENDACGVDAIQALTGCTFGKGNLIFQDHGKSVYTFFDRKTGKGLRYSTRDLPSSPHDEMAMQLFSMVREGTATDEERRTFNDIWLQKAIDVLRKGEDIFDIRELDIDTPEKARIFESFNCAVCGEKVGGHRIVEVDGEKLCIPCSSKRRGEP